MRLSVVDRRSDGDVFTLVHRLPLSFRTQTFYLSLVVGAFVPRRLSELDGTITDEFSRHLLHRLGVAIDVQERDEAVPLILPRVRLIRDHLCLGETRILGERSRQHVVVTLVPQITDENPKIILGHKNLSTTEIYTHILDEKMIKSIQENHPFAKKDLKNL